MVKKQDSDKQSDQWQTGRVECDDVRLTYHSTSFLNHLKRGKASSPMRVKNLGKTGLNFTGDKKMKVGGKIGVNLKIGHGRPLPEIKAEVRDVQKCGGRHPYKVEVAFVCVPPPTWHAITDYMQEEKDAAPKNVNVDVLQDTLPGHAVKKGNYLGKWSGTGERWIKQVKVEKPWRLLWATKGEYLSSFSVTVYDAGRQDTIIKPVNEHHLEGINDGQIELIYTGNLSLHVVTGGPDPMLWFILAGPGE